MAEDGRLIGCISRLREGSWIGRVIFGNVYRRKHEVLLRKLHSGDSLLFPFLHNARKLNASIRRRRLASEALAERLKIVTQTLENKPSRQKTAPGLIAWTFFGGA